MVSASTLPIYSVDEKGEASEFGTLSETKEGFIWNGVGNQWPLHDHLNSHHHSLPYFIYDLKPQGHMGKSFAKAYADDLMISKNIEHWSDREILMTIDMIGDDLPGNLIVGEDAYLRFIEKQYDIIRVDDVCESYLKRAIQAKKNNADHTLVGGEFPKFTAIRCSGDEIHHVIVKFSGGENTAYDKRWSDLLRCEAHSSQVIENHLGIKSAKTWAFEYQGRTFMESVRFDRVGLSGRKSMCSLSAIDAEVLGIGDVAWDLIADKLLELELIDTFTASRIRKIWYFGKLIGNGDMHSGNLSFSLDGKNKLTLCPVYDMLPMRYSPLKNGSMPSYKHHEINASNGFVDDFKQSAIAAAEFWRAVLSDDFISDDMKIIAEESINFIR